MAWWRFSRRAEEWREEAREHLGDARRFARPAIALLLYLLATMALGIYWSREPAQFSVTDAARRILPKQTEPFATGSATAATLFEVIATLLSPSSLRHSRARAMHIGWPTGMGVGTCIAPTSDQPRM